jgi:hypothetical protein
VLREGVDREVLGVAGSVAAPGGHDGECEDEEQNERDYERYEECLDKGFIVSP